MCIVDGSSVRTFAGSRFEKADFACQQIAARSSEFIVYILTNERKENYVSIDFFAAKFNQHLIMNKDGIEVRIDLKFLM